MALLSELLDGAGVIGGDLTDIGVNSIRDDSFRVTPGDVFVAVRGTKYDGHDFICIAVGRGAKVVVCERVTGFLENHPEVCYVLVENTRLALAVMWNNLCGKPSDRMMFAAVTGTNGKTSTAYFLRQIFREAGYRTGLIGTVRCFIGDESFNIDSPDFSDVNGMTTPAPETLYPLLKRMADAGVEIVFLEASSHSLDQRRLDPIRFIVSVFTNLTEDHLDYHGTMENYFEAKKRLIDLSEVAVVNIDDGWFETLCEAPVIPTVGFSPVGDERADFSARNQRCDLASGGIAYDVCETGKLYRITCPVSGDFTIANTLGAVSAARLFGIKPEIIRRALESCPQIPGRMEKVRTDRDFEVYIDYAHTPDALARAIKTLLSRRRDGGRLTVLFGCGGDREKQKRPEMGRIASALADRVIITGDNSRTENPRAIICDILRGIEDRTSCRVIERRRDAIRYAISTAGPGDVIILAGKGHEDYETDKTGKHRFVEREEITDALRLEREGKDDNSV